MNLYQPEVEQKIGTVIGGMIGLFTPALAATVINAVIGATVGFVITTLLRFIWERAKARWLKK